MKNAEEVIKRLTDLSPGAKDFTQGQSAIFGVSGMRIMGIPAGELEKLADEIGAPAHEIARDLWSSDVYEAKVLACLLADPTKMTDDRIDAIATARLPWVLIDLCCLKVISKTSAAVKKATEWSESDDVHFIYSGFKLAGIIAAQMPSDDSREMGFFDRCLFAARKQASVDDPHVSKAVSTALKLIGKRSTAWYEAAIETCKEIAMQNSRPAKWVASQTLADLLNTETSKVFAV